MKRILVTGASGFLGRHLVPRLLAKGYPLLLVSRRPFKCSSTQCQVIRCDLRNPRSVSRHATSLRSCEILIHLAVGMPYVERAESDLQHAFHDRVKVTTQLLEAAMPRYMLFASTIDVYGHAERLPIAEGHPIRPRTWYAAAKAASEAFLSTYAASNSLPIAIMRFTHLYGPGEASPKVIPRTIDSVLHGRRPVIYGGGSDTRDYLYVDDAVDAILRALRRRVTGVFNIGTGRETRIRDVIDLILNECRSKLRPVRKASRKPSMRIRLDVRKARGQFGFVAATDIGTGIMRTVKMARPTVVLDLDGTLINSRKRYYLLYRHLLGDRRALSESEYWSLKRQGKPEREIVSGSGLERPFLRSYELRRMELIEDWRFLREDTLFPWTVSILEEMSKSYFLALVTTRRNRHALDHQLRRLGLGRYFDDIVSARATRKRDVISAKASHLEQLGRCIHVVVGDTPADMELATRLEVPGVAVLTGIRDRRSFRGVRVETFIPSLQGLPGVLSRMERLSRDTIAGLPFGSTACTSFRW